MQPCCDAAVVQAVRRQLQVEAQRRSSKRRAASKVVRARGAACWRRVRLLRLLRRRLLHAAAARSAGWAIPRHHGHVVRPLRLHRA
jgi:hypothetical protein